MLQYSYVIDCGEEEARALRDLAFSTRLARFGNDLLCYVPSFVQYSIDEYESMNDREFIAFSVTGSRCQLQCDHCRGKILAAMKPISSPDQLYATVKEYVKEKGCTGILLSGGANDRGEVPFSGYTGILRRIKEEFGINCIVHTGLLGEEAANELAQAHVDAVMIDIIGDQEVVHGICHLNRPVKDYEDSIALLRTLGIPSVPHIVVGLNHGELKGEIYALEMVARHTPVALVIVVFMPVEGTPMQDETPPDLDLISRFLTLARLSLPQVPILLGCARPGGEYKQKLDTIAIAAGINGIAYPCQEAIKFSLDHQLHPLFLKTCCSLAYRHFQAKYGGEHNK